MGPAQQTELQLPSLAVNPDTTLTSDDRFHEPLDWICWPFKNADRKLHAMQPRSRSGNRRSVSSFITESTGAGLFILHEGDITSLSRFARISTDTWKLLEKKPTDVNNLETSGSPDRGWIGKAAMASAQAREMMKGISVLERAQIGACAGGIAGAITYTCLHPLDTIKTKLQTRGAAQLYSGPFDVIIKTFQKQGILGFYSGISAVLVGSTFSSGVYFGTCELGKALLVRLPNLPQLVIPPLAGAMGNLVSSAILVPKELITQRMQAGSKGRSWEVFLRIIEKEGFMGLYTGYSAALVRNLPASVLSFSSFEYLKAAWLRKTKKTRLEPWQSVVSGALAGIISSALTTPLDVVKTRLMTQARTMHIGASQVSMSTLVEAEFKAKIAASTYEGITSTLQRIWLEEGWRGLTRGVVPRMLHSACFSALGYFAFETARLELLKRHLAKQQKQQMVSLST